MQSPTQSPSRLIGDNYPTGIKLASIYPPASPTSSIGIVSQPETPLRNGNVEEVTSANGHLIVHDYGPTSAVFTVPVLLTTLLTYTGVGASDATLVHLRLNVGGKYIPTSVRPGPKSSLELHAVLSTELLARLDREVLLSIHAYRDERIFDSCDFGFLTELVGQAAEPAITSPSTPTRPSRKRLYSDFNSSDEEYVTNTPSKSKKHTPRSLANAGRSKRLPTLLVIKGDLKSVADLSSWSNAEEDEGRRLVLFSRYQTGHRIQLSLSPITRAELARTEGIIVSCLKPPGQDSLYITSVDLIRLITLLINPRTKTLGIEEKNRIRRSVEGFEPVTVKKNECETVGLFNYLMCLTEPRPITIAKDIKIFKWSILKVALEKILTKYDYDLESHALFEHAMGRKVSHPEVVHTSHATEVATASHTPAPSSVRMASPRPTRPTRDSFPVQLPPIRFLLPEVFVQSPDGPRQSPAPPSRRLPHARSPSPSDSSISNRSKESDPRSGTSPANRVQDASVPDPGVLAPDILTNLHQFPRNLEDDNYDEDDESYMIDAQGLLGESVQDAVPSSPSNVSSNSATDDIDNVGFLSTIQTQSRVETSQERFSLSHTCNPNASLGMKPVWSSPDGVNSVLSRSRQFSRSLTVPPAFRQASPRSRAISVATDPASLTRVPPCTPTDATFGRGSSPVEDFVNLLLALEEHQQLTGEDDDHDGECSCVGSDSQL